MRSCLAAVRHRLHPFLDLATPVAIAHRGGAEEAPENTMEAFGAASRSGLPAGGAHVTRDAVVLAFHDPRLPWSPLRPSEGQGPA
jgi:glycerophosphoryl diester phosphodiesterase